MLGRFLTRDAVLGNDRDLLSRNLYIYVKNNPLRYTDPTGNVPKEKLQQLLEEQRQWIQSKEYQVADYLNEAKDWNYQQSGNWAGKAGGFFLGLLGDSIENIAKANDQSLSGGERNWAKSMVMLDVGTLGGGSAVKQGVKEGAEKMAPKVLEMIQPSLRTSFKNGKFAGQMVNEVITKLKTGVISVEEIVVGYVERNGRNIVVNNKSFSVIKAVETEVKPVIRNLTGVKWAEDLTTKLLKQSPEVIYDILNIFK